MYVDMLSIKTLPILLFGCSNEGNGQSKGIHNYTAQFFLYNSNKMLLCFVSVIIQLLFVSNVLAKQPVDKFPLGMNLSEVADWSTQMPFLDLVKQSREWIPQRRGASWGKGGELDIDEYGWIRALKPGQSADLIFLTVKKPLIFKEYVVMYEGEGIVRYSGSARKVKTLGKGRDLITISERNNGYGILSLKKTNRDNYIRNIKIVPKEYLGEYLSGKIFNPKWLRYIRKFYALRFMDWMRTNNSLQEKWEDRPKVSDRTWATKGVPVEIMIKLANEIKSNVWFNIPHKADLTYMRFFAQLTKKLLNPELRIFIEHSNEVWNWGFQQSQFAIAESRRIWKKEGDYFMQWHGMRTAKMCDVWKSVFSREKDRVVCVLGIHPGWRGLEKAAIECPVWAKRGNKQCYEHDFDALAITGYFTGCLDGNAGWKKPSKLNLIRSWFSDLDVALKKAFLQADHGAFFPCERSLTGLKENYKYFKGVAQKYNLELFAYEGGQHISGYGTQIQNDVEFVRFHTKFNRSEYMYDLTRKNLENWKESGGALFMYYNDVGSSSKWGSWGSMNHLMDENSPKVRAIRDFSEGNSCWWSGC